MKSNNFKINYNISVYTAENSIFLVTKGVESPFYDIEKFKQIINLKATKGKVNPIMVYVDMFSCVKNENQRFLKFCYDKNKKNIIYSSIQNISQKELPVSYKKVMSPV